MTDPNVIPAANGASAPLSGSLHECLARFSWAQLTTAAALAVCVTSGIAYYAPHWWLVAVLTFSIAAAALAGAADRRIGVLSTGDASYRASSGGPLRALRGFAAALAALSVIAFLLIGVARVLGSPGSGG